LLEKGYIQPSTSLGESSIVCEEDGQDLEVMYRPQRA